MTDTITPLARLQQLLATDRCTKCFRFTELEPEQLAERLGVSETTVRRLTETAYVPSMATVTKMATALALSPLELMGKLWPELGPRPEPVLAAVDEPDEAVAGG